ncbi:MAG: 5'-3' exonuclease H3TH domain-containing protein [Ilumatobacteraceae bacterium]
MHVHLIDGTYELYRQHYGQAIHGRTPPPFAGTIGVLKSTIQLLEDGARYVAVATDHTIESFRNDLYDGYKTSEGMEPVLLEQIPLLEEALTALGVTVWAMTEFEADDALASAAENASNDRRVHKVSIYSPDKDLAQCVSGKRVVQYDRRNRMEVDEAAVHAKFGIGPRSIPDYLALVGDTSDGYPGLKGWGAKSASQLLAMYETVENIPRDHTRWKEDGLTVRGAEKLASVLVGNEELLGTFKTLATLRKDAPVGHMESWKWDGPTPALRDLADQLGASVSVEKVYRLK